MVRLTGWSGSSDYRLVGGSRSRVRGRVRPRLVLRGLIARVYAPLGLRREVRDVLGRLGEMKRRKTKMRNEFSLGECVQLTIVTVRL